MKPERFRTIIDVHLLLIRDAEILLAQRQGTGYADGQWHMPSGHLEEGESATECAAREAHEETGIKVDPTSLQLGHTMHRGHETELPRLGLFFVATAWEGEPVNAEPHKCGGVEWFPLDELPAEMVPYPRAGLDNYLSGIAYAELGW
ncbi:NUDIX domain-containing protein [Kribbella sp. NPDC051587]|uniref:NUDIX hydrolase n=1 Tax=Kribbella sp. NPDC051587 TaxID=3364119 RepID=UPI00378DF560